MRGAEALQGAAGELWLLVSTAERRAHAALPVLQAVVAAYEQRQGELSKENRDLKASLASLQVHWARGAVSRACAPGCIGSACLLGALLFGVQWATCRACIGPFVWATHIRASRLQQSACRSCCMVLCCAAYLAHASCPCVAHAGRGTASE